MTDAEILSFLAPGDRASVATARLVAKRSGLPLPSWAERTNEARLVVLVARADARSEDEASGHGSRAADRACCAARRFAEQRGLVALLPSWLACL